MTMRHLVVMFAGALAVMAQLRPAEAQLVGTGLGSSTLQGAAPFGNPINDTRVYVHAIFNQLEGRLGNGLYLRWEGQAWAGDDYN